MFLNVEQLEKQLDKEDFQEIGSMAAFNVIETQIQMFITSRIYLNDEYVVMTRSYFQQYTKLAIPKFRDTLIQHMEYVKKSIDEREQHKREYDSWVNERQMQTTEEKVDTSKAFDASLVETKSSGTYSKEHDTSSRSRNDAHDDDAVSDPYMMKSQWLRWKSTGQSFKTIGLRWVPTGKIFNSSTIKIESEPPNGSNEDISNQYECEQTLYVSVGTLNINAGTSFKPKKEGLRVWLLKRMISAKIPKNQTITTQDQKPQRKAGSRSKFSANNLTMKLNLSKVQV
nr:hypothetical protein [Tanacetum cinerariifolium]